MLFWNKIHQKKCPKFGLKNRNVVFGVMVAWFSVCGSIWGDQSVSLAWNATSGVAGYVVYSGGASGNYSRRIDVGTNTMATISNLKEGKTNYFTVTAYNIMGVESQPAGELSYIVPGVVTLTPGATAGDPMGINFPVAPSHWYEVQATSDLKSWVTVQRTAMATSNAWTRVLDPRSGVYPIRYYRLVMH
jgi:hypothetical protein